MRSVFIRYGLSSGIADSTFSPALRGARTRRSSSESTAAIKHDPETEEVQEQPETVQGAEGGEEQPGGAETQAASAAFDPAKAALMQKLGAKAEKGGVAGSAALWSRSDRKRKRC